MIQVNYRDGRPIYEQIKDNFIKLIVTGALTTDTKIPSVRELASMLSINPNTIQRAYRELENEGYIYKVSGRGSFVAEIDPAKSPILKELFDRFDKLAGQMREMNIAKKRLIEHLDKIFDSDLSDSGKTTGAKEVEDK